MLKIQVDLQEEYNILVCARQTSNLRRKAKEGQHCFVKQDIKRFEELEYLLSQQQTQACAEKDKGLVPLTVLALSKKNKIFIIVKNHCHIIADAYTDWYTCHQTVSQTSNSTYFYCDPLEVDFEFPPGAPKKLLNGYLAET